MKKYTRILLLTAFVACVSESQAQFFSGGIAGSIGIGNVRIRNTDSGYVNSIDGNSIYGYELGLYAKIKLAPFYIKPQLLYGFRSGQVTYTDRYNNNQRTTFSLHRIELPVYFGMKLIGPLCIEAAPVYHYVLGVTERYNNTTAELGRSGLGYRVGGALDFGNVILNVTWEGVTYTSSGNRATFSQPYQLIVGAAIRLGGGDDEVK